MKVFESDLLVAGAHCMTHYRDCKDIGSYICGDTIVDIAAIRLQNTNRIVAMVACRGGTVNAIERGRVLAMIRLPIGPSLLFPPATTVNSDFVYCGATDGSIYSLKLDREHGSIEAHSYMDIKRISGLSAVGWWDTPNGFNAPVLLLGYSDGSFQIFTLKTDPAKQTSQLLFTYNFDESVTSVTGWNKGVVVATRSGRIIGLTTPLDASTTTIKLNKLKEDVQELEVKIEKERSQYRIATQPLSQGLSAIPTLQINDEWGPVEADGARRLCISLGAPLDILLIQSNAPLLLLDTSPNTALLTRAVQMKGENKLLATFRCQANTQQLEMRIGVWQEAITSAGKINIYVTPLLQPKCCQLLKYRVAPLFWHIPIEEFDEDGEYNTLTVLGAFSRAEAHAWLCCVLPEVPNRPQQPKTSVTHKSIITDTLLNCNYQKGEAIFKSDSVSTISIIKDFLSAEATKKKVQLEISINVNNNTTMKILDKIHPQISSRFQQLKEEKLIKALSELQSINEKLEENICKEYANLLSRKHNSDEVKTLQLKQLFDIVVSLFVDSYKLKGYNTKNKTQELQELLECYENDTIKNFFVQNLI
ncbi:BBSome complex member BBS7-like isoform X2 [Arctopsyche grandis]